jgi:hypothetical protein
MTEIEKSAYAAGIFDGEGYVDIYQATLSKASKSPSLMLRVVISQKDGRLMHWLQDNFGGHVQQARKDKYSIYRWDIRSQAAARFLSQILPYIVVKKEQALIALQYETMKGKYLETLKGSRGFRQLTEKEMQERLALKDQLKKLKREYSTYTKNGAATTTKRKDLVTEDVIV